MVRSFASSRTVACIAVQANEVVVIPPATAHSYGADENAPWSIMWAHCRGDEVAGFLKCLAVTKASPLLRTPAGAFDRMEFSAIYFSRLFKKIMGKPPRAYRKIQKG